MSKISIDDCVYRIQANISAYVSPDMERCRNCADYDLLHCDRYKSVRVTQLPIRYGRAALVKPRELHRNTSSVNSLTHEVEQ